LHTRTARLFSPVTATAARATALTRSNSEQVHQCTNAQSSIDGTSLELAAVARAEPTSVCYTRGQVNSRAATDDVPG